MKRIIIGRSSKSDYVINDGTVSSSHALITVLDSGEREFNIKLYN